MKRNILEEGLRLCVCGGGNSSHVMAGLCASRGIPVDFFAPFEDEAERLEQGMREAGGIKVLMPDGSSVLGKPGKASKNAADVVPQANVVFLPLPSIAYRTVLEGIAPHLAPGTIIAVTPGLGGFDWLCADILGDKLNDVVIAGIPPLPWNCRINDFGKEVFVQGWKNNLRIATNLVDAADKEEVRKVLSTLLDLNLVPMDTYLAVTMWPLNPVIHPQRLYSLFKDYKPGVVYPENPLFYESMSDFGAEYIQKATDEARALCVAMEKRCGIELLKDVPDIGEFVISVYGDVIEDRSCLRTIFSTCDGYKGFGTPMLQVEGGWIPDFNSRYFTEDIPHGLCVYRGIADLLDMELPVIDEVLAWAQGLMGKEYIKDGRLAGKDVGETYAPQVFGAKTIEDVPNIARPTAG
jgi:hypothetical protein